jgi:hypothetical protein
MNNNNEIAIQGNNPIANIKVSTDVAGACKEIVSRSAINIGNKKYVPVEGWMAIATAHGCNLSATDVRQIDGGISARGLVRRISDGLVIGEAEGFVGDDEKTWANRALFARRAMAQTRAMSRAARSVFAHVVVLMDAGLSTTPAEEMESMEVKEEPKKPEVKQEVKPEPKKANSDQVITKFNQSFSDAIVSMQGQRLVEMTIKILDLSKNFSATQWGTVLQHTKNELVKLQNQIESNLVVIDLEYKTQLAEVCNLFKYDDLHDYFISISFVNRIYDIIERGFDFKEFNDSKKYVPANITEGILADVGKLLDHYKERNFNENKLINLCILADWFGLQEHAQFYRNKKNQVVISGGGIRD